MSRSTTSSRLPVGTIPGVLILTVLVVLGVAMWRSSGSGPNAESLSTTQQQPDYSHAERRDPDDPFTAGPVDAPVGLVMFSDYQCPFCAQWTHETLPVLKERAEQGELRIEIRDVNVYGPDSERAARSSYAAAVQDSYWEFHDALFEDGRTRTSDQLSREALLTLAAELGLDRERFADDMSSPAAAEEIARNEQLGTEHGAVSTPVFILGGTPIVGAQPTSVFIDTFRRALDAANESASEPGEG